MNFLREEAKQASANFVPSVTGVKTVQYKLGT